MTDIILAEGRSVTPRQEWLGPASTTNPGGRRSAQSGEPTGLRLVGHKVLAQGSGRPSASSASTGTPAVYERPAGGITPATRALASFSQQLDGDAYAKGRYIDTYA